MRTIRYFREEEKGNRPKALIGAILLHALFLLGALFFIMVKLDPPPIEEGIEVALGFPDEGMGNGRPIGTPDGPNQPNPTNDPPPPPSPSNDDNNPNVKDIGKDKIETDPPKKSPPPKKVEDKSKAKEDILTQDKEDAIELKKKKDAEKKKVEEENRAKASEAAAKKKQYEEELSKKKAAEDAERRRVDEERRRKAAEAKAEADRQAAEAAKKAAAKAKYGGAFGGGKTGGTGTTGGGGQGEGGTGKGNTRKPGNQGDPNGNPDSDNLSGIRRGSGRVGGNLSGRKVLSQPMISDDSQETGNVVVKVCVDKTGHVVSAIYTQNGSTTSDPNLKAKAIAAAKKFKFDQGELEEQCGTITIEFKVR